MAVIAEPVVIVNSNDTEVIEQLKAAGFYDTIIEQMDRAEKQPNTIFTASFADGRTNVLHYASYHCKADDSGWLLISIENPIQAVVETVEAILLDLYNSPIQMLYMDDPERRN